MHAAVKWIVVALIVLATGIYAFSESFARRSVRQNVIVTVIVALLATLWLLFAWPGLMDWM
jgi:hypothetical protein